MPWVLERLFERTCLRAAAIGPDDVPQPPAHAAGDIDDGPVTRSGDIGHARSPA